MFDLILFFMEALVSAVLNPILLLMVLFHYPKLRSMGLHMVDLMDSGCTKIFWRTYLLFSLVFWLAWQVLLYFLFSLGYGMALCDFLFAQHLTWVGWLAYIFMAPILGQLISPPGHNIHMSGLFFLPMIIVSAGYLVIRHFIWVYHHLAVPYVSLP